MELWRLPLSVALPLAVERSMQNSDPPDDAFIDEASQLIISLSYSISLLVLYYVPLLTKN